MISLTTKHSLLSHGIKIIEKLGEGGMGIVYKAEDIKLKRTVALKFLPPHLTKDEEANTRFITEAQAASALDHQNICTIFDIKETDDDQMFIVMAYYEGETLRQQMARGKLQGAGSSGGGSGSGTEKTGEQETSSSPRRGQGWVSSASDGYGIEIADAIDITSQIAAGLTRAHEADITHRDIKPSNIMITERGEVKILDFGIARIAGQKAITKTGSTLGTVAYMSPEQVRGEQTDRRTDIWSLGVVLYEMLTGQQPFQGEFDQAVMYSICNQPHEPVSALREDVPEFLEQIVNKALAKKADERYQDVGEMLGDLQGDLTLPGFETLAELNATISKSATTRKTTAPFAIAAVLVTMALIYLFTRSFVPAEKSPDEVAETVSRNRVAVLPFSLRGSNDYRFLEDGMIDLLSMKLDGAGDWQRVDPHALQSYVARHVQGVLDPDSGRAIAEHFGAGLYVLGNIFQAGNQIQLSASLYDIDSGLQQSVQTEVMGQEQIFALVDALARQLLAGRSDVTTDRIQRLAAVTTSSFPALKAYLEGEAKIRAGQYESAIDALQVAVQEDTTFALAYYRMAYAAYFSPARFAENRPAIAQALRYAGNLAKPDLDLLNAMHHYLNGEARAAENLYRAIVSDHPDDLEAWLLLGALLVNYGPRMGRSMQEARLALKRSLALKPDNPIAFGFLMWIVTIEGMVAEDKAALAELDSLLTRRLELAPEVTWALVNRMMLAHIRNDESVRSKLIDEFRQANTTQIWQHCMAVDIHTENYHNARMLAGLLTEPSRSPFWQARGHQTLALMALSRGKLSTAVQELATVQKIYPAYPVEEFALALTMPLIDLSPETARQLAEKAASWSFGKTRSPIRRNYALGLIHAHLGEETAALLRADSIDLYAGELQNRRAAGQAIAMARDLAHSVRASLFWKRGEVSKGLEMLEEMQLEGWWGPVPGYLVDSQAHERYMRAEMLKASGRYEEAIRWLSTLGTATFPEIIYRAPKHLLLAEIYAEIGQPEKAIAHYSRFVKLWQDCDPELRWRVEEAEERMAKLRGLNE